MNPLVPESMEDFEDAVLKATIADLNLNAKDSDDEFEENDDHKEEARARGGAIVSDEKPR